MTDGSRAASAAIFATTPSAMVVVPYWVRSAEGPPAPDTRDPGRGLRSEEVVPLDVDVEIDEADDVPVLGVPPVVELVVSLIASTPCAVW